MRTETITCDWCGAEPNEHYLTLHERHIGAFATYEGARYNFDFCDYACLAEWKAHKGCPRKVVEATAARKASP